MKFDSMLATPISQILRYHPIVKYIKGLKRNNHNLSILEVGSGSSGITKFIKTEVTGMDIGFSSLQSPYLKKVEHSAIEAFPFKDNEFDVVISVDCYNYLPKARRRICLEEMYRVSGKYMCIVIVTENKWYKRVLDKWDKKKKMYMAMESMEKAGSPTLSEIGGFLKGMNCKYRMERGTPPAVSYFLNILDDNIFTKALGRTVLKLFVPVLVTLKGKERVYFFITKQHDGKKRLRKNN